jgi:hypothetical protein
VDVLRVRKSYLDEVLAKGEFFVLDPITQRYNAEIAMQAWLKGNTAIVMRSLAICEYFFKGRKLSIESVTYALSLDGDPLAKKSITALSYQADLKYIWQRDIKIGRAFYESILRQRRAL